MNSTSALAKRCVSDDMPSCGSPPEFIRTIDLDWTTYGPRLPGAFGGSLTGTGSGSVGGVSGASSPSRSVGGGWFEGRLGGFSGRFEVAIYFRTQEASHFSIRLDLQRA